MSTVSGDTPDGRTSRASSVANMTNVDSASNFSSPRRRGSVSSSTFTAPASRGSSVGPMGRPRAGSRAHRRGDEINVRKAKFAAFSSAPSLGVDAETMDEVSDLLPDMSELQFARQGHGPCSGEIITLSLRHFCKRVSMTATHNSSGDTPVEATILIEDVQAMYDSAVDDCTVFVRTKGHLKNLTLRDFQRRLVVFENRSDREHFIAHLFTLGRVYQRREDADTDPIPVITLSCAFRSADEAQKVMMQVEKDEKAAEKKAKKATSESAAEAATLDSTDQDYLGLPDSRPAVASKIAAFGDTCIFFSSEAQTKDNKHDIVVLTDSALYLGKVRKDDLRQRIPYSAIEGVAFDNGSDDLVMVELDFTQVQIRGDLVLRFPRARQRDTLLKVLTKLYEEVVVDRLRVTHVDDIFWAKRGYMECQRLRLLHVFKQKRTDDGAAKRKEDEEAAKWLLWTVQHQLHVVVGCIAPTKLGDRDKQFVGRSLLSLCRHLNTTEQLLRCCVQFELFGCCGVTPKSSHVARSVFQEPTLTSFILEEYCVGNSEQFISLILGQTLEEFAAEPKAADEDLVSVEDNALWVNAILKPLYEIGRSADVIPTEVKTVFALIADVWQDADRAHRHHRHHGGASLGATQRRKDEDTLSKDPYRIVGTFLFSKMLCPVINDPQGQGLLFSPLNEQQLINLRRISNNLLAAGTFCSIGAARNAVGDTADLVLELQPALLEYLKDIIFSGYAGDPPQAPKFSSTSFRQISLAVESLQVDEANWKLLVALNRVFGSASARIMNAGWVAGALSVTDSAQDGSSNTPQARALPDTNDRSRREGSVLDMSDDDDDISPPGVQKSRAAAKPPLAPNQPLIVSSTSNPDLGSSSAKGRSSGSDQDSLSRDAKKRLDEMEAENKRLRQQLGGVSERLMDAERRASHFLEQGQHFRQELMRERGITDENTTDDDLLAIEQILRKIKRGESTKDLLDSGSSDSDNSDDDLLSNDSGPASPKNRSFSKRKCVSFRDNGSFSPNGGKANPLNRSSSAASFSPSGSSPNRGGARGVGIPSRPWGCPLDSCAQALYADPWDDSSL